MKTKIICLIAIAGGFKLGFSQNITGTVVDEKSNPLPKVSVTLLSKNDSNVVDHSSTTNDGRFAVKFSKYKDYLLQLNHLGHKQLLIELSNVVRSMEMGIIKMESDTTLLDGVTVSASSSFSKVDRQIAFPTPIQIKNSSSGYSLLRRLAFPGIKVDETQNTISSYFSKGAVQMQINGKNVTSADIVALDPGNVIRVDYIDNPGVRYGENVGAVINFLTKKVQNGLRAGFNIINSVTDSYGNDNIFFRMSRGISEIGVVYSVGYKQFYNRYSDNILSYVYPDNTIYTIERNSERGRFKQFTHNLQLNYNITKADKYTFSAVIRNSIQDNPENVTKQLVTDSRKGKYGVEFMVKDKLQVPALDLYGQIMLPRKQHIVFNTVGSYLESKYSYAYKEFYSSSIKDNYYGYVTNGEKYSFIGEAIYEKEFSNLTYSAGIQYGFSSLSNGYESETFTSSNMHNSNLYLYMQFSGKVKSLSYVAGIGISDQQYKQDNNQYAFRTLRPTLSISYPITKGLRIRYNFSIRPNLPKLANISRVKLNLNEWEVFVGNPELKPFISITNSIQLSYQRSRFMFQYSGVYMNSSNAIMPTTERKIEGANTVKFEFGAKNQKSMNQLVNQAYIQYDIVPDKVNLTGYVGLNRYFSNGDDYTHQYNAWFGGGQAMFYMGKWNLALSYDSRYKSLFGETISYTENSSSIDIYYRFKSFKFGAGWMYPFQKNGLKTGDFSKNRYRGADNWDAFYDYGNMITLKLSWSLQKGKKYSSVEKKLNNSDDDSGVVKSR